jgi:uncharacterized glyoxalase superfamily protein PhnB
MPAAADRARLAVTMRYADPDAMIDWLGRAFGFEPGLVVRSPEGVVEHAQLGFPGGMAMLGAERDDTLGRLTARPAAAGGRCTAAPYIVVDDADEHHARAVAAGAEVVMPLVTASYGGRGYSCRDPEGQLWHFGTYDPWAAL